MRRAIATLGVLVRSDLIRELQMSILEQALFEWRRTRRNVSDHRETNIAAWLVELQQVLAAHGLTQDQLGAEEGLHSFVEQEYAAREKKPPAGR